MTLGTHAVVGATVAMLFPSHPIIAFFAGFFSHYILDAIPHWDYNLASTYSHPHAIVAVEKAKIDRAFFVDLTHVGLDMFLGFVIILFVWYSVVFVHWQILLLGMIGGVLPDCLQFIYARFPHQPMVLVQKFHSIMHTKLELENKPVIGVSLQILTMICFIVLVKYLIKF